MITQSRRASARETMQDFLQDFLMVSSFGFWAVLLGFVPVAAIHMLTT
jgi:hypothetical protein